MGQTVIVELSQAKQNVFASLILETVLEGWHLPDKMTQMTEAFRNQTHGGACRCFFTDGKATFFGFSDKGEKVHAEEDCFMKMKNSSFSINTATVWLMYVDLEPCRDARYAGHNCRAYFDSNLNLDNSLKQKYSIQSNAGLYYPYLTNGVVLYAFPQAEKGTKSQAELMHGKHDEATARFIQLCGGNMADYNKNVHGIEYYKLGNK